jgi:hypothetical protein
VKGPDEKHHRQSDQAQDEQKTAEAVESAASADGGGAHDVIGRAEFAGVGQFCVHALALEEPGALAEGEVFEFGGADVGFGHGGRPCG